MNVSRPSFAPFRIFPVAFALIFNVLIGPLAPVAQLATAAAGPSVTDYAQCQNGNPRSAALDCPGKWINGILNATHSDYSEDQVVPQRALIDYGSAGTGHSVQIAYLARKSGSATRHAYDYLATWNYTQVNADRCQTPTATACPAGPASVFPIPSDGTSLTPGGPQPTSAHELPQADRQFVMYGGTITGTSAITHTTAIAADGSDYGVITINFNATAADGKVQLLFGGHLAAGLGPRGWGANLGAAAINGGPYHIRLTAVDGASIGNRDNQIMSGAIQPVAAPTLEITKTPDAATVNAGAQIGFTITVHNAGPGVATAATLSDPLPGGSGVDWSISPAYAGPGSCSITGSAPTQTLGCSFGDLAADASASVHVVSRTAAASCKTYANTATADADNFGPVTASASTTVNCPNLTLSKTPDGGTVNAGSNISFTLTLSNSGPGAATNVNIDDVLPVGFTWTESPDLTECAIAAGALHCDIASLASGASFAVTVTAPTTGSDCGKVTNHATADADNYAQVSDDGDVTILCADVGVKKTGNGPINAGDTAVFTIVVTASGSTASTNVTLADNLPAGITWTLGGANAAACSIDTSASPDALSCNFGTMAPEATRTITLSGTADKAQCPSISNTATVSSTVNTDPSNDSSTATIAVNCGNVVLTKTPDAPGDIGGTVNAGGVATFTIVVGNTGTGTARGVHVEDQLPDVSGTWAVDNANCSVNGSNLLTCDLPDMLTGTSVTLHLTTRVGLGDCGTLSNPLAEVTTTNDGSAHDSGSIVVTCPNLKITKTSSTPVVTAGDVVHYRIKVDNSTGSGTATGVTITDNLPGGLTWRDDSNSCKVTGSVLSCGPLDIAAGASFSVTVTGTTDAGSCPSLSNVASFASDNAGSGSTASAPTVITVNCPNLTITKSADNGTISAGDLAAYTIVVTNEGPGTATNVHVQENVPAGVTWTVSVEDPQPAGSGCTSSVASDQPQSISCDFSSLAAGASVTIHLSGETTTANCGTLHNVATVSAGNEDRGMLEDNSASADIVVECPGINIAKSNNQTGSVLPGTNVTYTLLVTLTDGTAKNVTVVDTLPNGLDAPTNISDAGTWDASARTITWHLGDLTAGQKSVTYQARVSADVANGTQLRNVAVVFSPNSQCPNIETLGPECTDTSTVTTRVPTLVIEKAVDRSTVDVTAGKDTTVTWTLSYTLANGPVTNAVISDPLPTGLNYVAASASNGGVYDAASRTLTWTFPSLGASGSVTFRTTVDASVGGGVTLLNVATIDSNETTPDNGQASIRTTEQEQQGVTGTPAPSPSAPSVPNTSIGSAGNGQPLNVPIWLMLLVFLGSLGGLGLANVKAVQRRR